MNGHDRTPRTESERRHRRRVQLCEFAWISALAVVSLTAVLALFVFPTLFGEPSLSTIWTVRGIAVLGWLIGFFSMYFDQSYRGEYLANKEGEHMRKEVRRASVPVVLTSALPVLAIFLLYPSPGGSG